MHRVVSRPGRWHRFPLIYINPNGKLISSHANPGAACEVLQPQDYHFLPTMASARTHWSNWSALT
jgi:hypothetical protein